MSPKRPLFRPVLAALAVAVSMAFVGCGGTPEISVSDAVIPVPASPSEAAMYLSITNSGGADDELISVKTEASPAAHLHQSEIAADGLATMTALNTLIIPAGETVNLAPGGLHVMLMRPVPLLELDTVQLTLNFKKSGAKTVIATVVGSVDEVIGS